MESSENVRRILGMKVKQFRQERGFSLKELSGAAGLSPSYINEIEKGKKYPKADKIIQLARALQVSYDELVSVNLGKELSDIAELLESPLMQEFPFELFGVTMTDVFDLVAQFPKKASALINALIEVARIYDMRVEHFFFAALRSYQEMHNNYFEELEESVDRFVEEKRWRPDPPVDRERLEAILKHDYGYEVIETGFENHPELQSFRSVWLDGDPPRLLVNERLLPSQKAFILGRELGYLFLKLKERARTSSWLKVESFEQVLNNFKASYFSGALMMNRNLLSGDLTIFLKNEKWDPKAFLGLIRKYDVTPEMFMYRLSVMTKIFNLSEMHFLRFSNPVDREIYPLTKQLNLSKFLIPHGVELSEHFCRRWLSISLLKEMSGRQKKGDDEAPIIAAQRSTSIEDGAEFFSITIARPLALTDQTNTSVTLGFRINTAFKDAVRFWNDPAIPERRIGSTCQRCELEDCLERAAPPSIYNREQALNRRDAALQKLVGGMEPVADKITG